MNSINLPCVKCGTSLPITSGSTIQCFACGTTNGYTESIDLLKDWIIEMFGYNGVLSEANDKITMDEIHKRMTSVDSRFSEYLSESRKIDISVVSKIDEIDFETNIEILRLNLGVLSTVMENFLIPILDNALQLEQYSEMKALLNIRNLQLTGLLFTIEAKNEFEIEITRHFYEKASSVFMKAFEYAKKFAENSPNNFELEELISKASADFSNLLSEFLTNNPAYYADELEQSESLLKDLTDIRALKLKKQIISFYNLGNSIMFLLEEFRKKEPFKPLQIQYERIPFYTQEIKEDVITAKNWVENLEKKFLEYQKQLMKIHSGKMTSYLEGLRTDFQLRNQEIKKEFNNKIISYVSTTLSDFAIEIDDDFELLDIIIDGSHYILDEIVQRFENIKFNMQALESTIKGFLVNLLEESFDPDLRNLHLKDIIEGISERHALFDKKIYTFINFTIEKFTEIRNMEKHPLEKQKSLFETEYLPHFKSLIKLSFTISLDDIPFPLFMELIILSNSFEVESENRLVLLLENPGNIALKNVGVTFFVPNSFQIKRRIVKVGTLKSQEKVTIDTEFVPTEDGYFKLMALVNYNHVKDSFWMPSLQVSIKVGDPDKQQRKLKELYEKHGIDINILNEIKEMENSKEGTLEEKLKSYLQLDDNSIEREDLERILKEVETIEDEVQEDSYYDENDLEPYSDVTEEDIKEGEESIKKEIVDKDGKRRKHGKDGK